MGLRFVSSECRIDQCRSAALSDSLYCRPHRNEQRRAKANAYDSGSDGKLTGSKPKLTPEQVAEAKRMWSQFKSNREIAAHFGVSIPTITKALKHRPKDVAS